MVEKPVQRRLAAIVVADVVGYSRLMEADETGTLAMLKQRRKGILEPTVRAHGGRVVKLMGDGVLIEFASLGRDADAAPYSRVMRLTPELVARIAPYVGESHPFPNPPPSDADYDEAVREILAAAPSTRAHQDRRRSNCR